MIFVNLAHVFPIDCNYPIVPRTQICSRNLCVKIFNRYLPVNIQNNDNVVIQNKCHFCINKIKIDGLVICVIAIINFALFYYITSLLGFPTGIA